VGRQLFTEPQGADPSRHCRPSHGRTFPQGGGTDGPSGPACLFLSLLL